ncbi:thiamine pyrophosphate-dependent enzyme [Candidatus Bathyarchaeota archaeon]|jgi:pyruvate ferredoxin oxidoreductase beta subunit|nr:thiamine pyrophosphate-dependent enzyme [Candidatus Bathyarchaeota archaeon]
MTTEQFDKYYEESKIQGGTTCCPGCGGPLFWKMALKTFGANTIVYGDGPCAMCALRSIKVPHFAIHFSFIADGATGINAALRAQGRNDITLISSGGDGATSDISFGKVSAAAERNENMIQICIDNEAYMNTGIQKSGLTPYGAWTTTTPTGKESNKKDIPMIIAAHKVPYVATASVAYPQDLAKKLEKAKSIEGFKYIHTVIPCPTGWRFDPAKAVEVTRLGVDTWVNPLYEVEKGVLKVNRKTEAKPVQEYLKAQGRFRQLSEDQITYIQSEVDTKRDDLLANDGKQIIH